MTDELDVTNYDLEAERTARREADERSTKEIRDMISAVAVGEHAYWIASACVSRARAELAALLQRNKELETENAVMRKTLGEVHADQSLARVRTLQEEIESALTHDTGKVVEKLPSLARVQEILKDVDGVHSSSQAFPADAIRRIGSLWGYAHELAEMVCALPVTWGQEEVTPDTGKRVVDVAWLQRIEWGGTADIGRGGMRYSHCPDCGAIELDGHDRDCKLAELKGEGANDD